MSLRFVLVILAFVVASSLVGAPATMHDWGQQGTHYAYSVEDPDDEVPVLQYDSLSEEGQAAVRAAIESDGSHTVYGYDDLPQEFSYSDHARAGEGIYIVEYEGQQYRLETMVSGGFPFVYWAMELPFVLAGALLAWADTRLIGGDEPPAAVAVGVILGVGVHLVGPAFDFPVVEPGAFFRLGIVLAVVFSVWMARGLLPDSLRPGVDGA